MGPKALFQLLRPLYIRSHFGSSLRARNFLRLTLYARVFCVLAPAAMALGAAQAAAAARNAELEPQPAARPAPPAEAGAGALLIRRAANGTDTSVFGSILAPAGRASLVGGPIEDLAPIHATSGISGEYRWIVAAPGSTPPDDHNAEVRGFAKAYFLALAGANRGASDAEHAGMAWWLAVSRSTVRAQIAA